MLDLVLPTAVVLCASLWGFVLCQHMASRCRPRLLTLTLILLFLVMLTYLSHWHGRLALAQYVPLSGAIVWTNLTPVFMACLAGIVTGTRVIPRRRRLPLAHVIALTAIWALVHPMWPPAPPPTSNLWKHGVALQASSTTCSPAALATLLTAHHIPLNEADVAPLTLTRSGGTPPLGIYRAARHFGAWGGLDVEILPADVEQLLEQDEWPVIVQVGVPSKARNIDPRFLRDWGWEPGVTHSIVVFGRIKPDRIEVGDPSVGREIWRTESLRVLYRGEGIRLVNPRRHTQASNGSYGDQSGDEPST